MFDFIKRHFKSNTDIKEVKEVEQPIDDNPFTKVCDIYGYDYPATDEELPIILKTDELKLKVEHALEDYNLPNLSVYIGYHKGWQGSWLDNPIRSFINVRWTNGVTQGCPFHIVNKVCNEHEKMLNIAYKYFHGFEIHTTRKLSNDAVLAACRKYADCISKDLPINMSNIRCLKLGGTTLYDLVVAELQEQTIDE